MQEQCKSRKYIYHEDHDLNLLLNFSFGRLSILGTKLRSQAFIFVKLQSQTKGAVKCFCYNKNNYPTTVCILSQVRS